MRLTIFSAHLLRQFLRKNRIATLPQLKQRLGTEADIPVFRKLKELSFRTSYSHRGSFYTLDEIAAFDELGLWSFDSVWFSRHGTLVASAEVCVTQAPAGRRLSCLPACSTNNNGVCTLAWNRSSWVEIARSPNFSACTRTRWPKDDGNCWPRRWKWAEYGAWVEDANRWKKNARGDRCHPQAHGKGNRWGPHQWAEVDQENHRQDRSTAQTVGDCSRPQHCRTAAAADEVFPAHQSQEDFRRFYFRPRPPVPLSLSAARSVRKTWRSGPQRGCQKERELIENFKNPGVKWEQSSTDVNDHDFRSAAKRIGIPYAIYDTQANRGCVFLGTSHETSAFAVSCLRRWWQIEGHKRYPQSRHILILAETGGSNGAQRGAWKQEIQRQLCDGLGLSVTVSHYPSGALTTSEDDCTPYPRISEVSDR